MTIHVPARRSSATEVDDVALASLAGVRLAAVLWGGLAGIDLGRVAHAPAYVDTAFVVLVVGVASIGMSAGTALGVAVVGWLLLDGFVTHRFGVLSYDGAPDLARFALLAGVAVVAMRVHR